MPTTDADGSTRTAVHGLTFHESMLRQNQPVTGEKQPAQADKAAEALARRQNGARRTAWIIAAIAIAFFIASLVQGHLAQIPH